MFALNASQAISNTRSPESTDKKIDLCRETLLFQKSLNLASTDLYRLMSQVRSNENRNFIFFTPNLIASLSMLYAGAPEELKRAMEEALHMGELKEDKWHTHFNAWSNLTIHEKT